MDGEAWQAAVHGVAQSWTRLKQLSSSSSSSIVISLCNIFYKPLLLPAQQLQFVQCLLSCFCVKYFSSVVLKLVSPSSEFFILGTYILQYQTLHSILFYSSSLSIEIPNLFPHYMHVFLYCYKHIHNRNIRVTSLFANVIISHFLLPFFDLSHVKSYIFLPLANFIVCQTFFILCC